MAGTTRMLMQQKRPRKKMGRKQRKSFKDNPVNGIPWANWFDAVTGAVPTIGTLAPATGLATDGPTLITVTGTNFGPGSVVYADGASLSTNYVSLTTLTATFDPTVAATVQFTVRNGTGQVSANKPFTVT